MNAKAESSVKLAIEVVEYDTKIVVKTLGPYDTPKRAAMADTGLNRNLNHDKFYTRIVRASPSVRST